MITGAIEQDNRILFIAFGPQAPTSVQHNITSIGTYTKNDEWVPSINDYWLVSYPTLWITFEKKIIRVTNCVSKWKSDVSFCSDYPIIFDYCYIICVNRGSICASIANMNYNGFLSWENTKEYVSFTMGELANASQQVALRNSAPNYSMTAPEVANFTHMMRDDTPLECALIYLGMYMSQWNR